MKVAVLIGHYPFDPAQSEIGHYTEYGECAAIVGHLVRYLVKDGMAPWVIGAKPLSEKITDINILNPSCAVEVHLNGFKHRAEGHETLYYPGSSSGKVLAGSIQEQMNASMTNPDRGIKEGYHWEKGCRTGVLGLLEGTICTSVIVEPWFLEHELKFLGGTDTHKKVAGAIAAGVLDWKIRVNN